MTNNPKLLQRTIDVHGQLAQLIAPATPASIRASSLKNNPTLKWSFIMLFFSVFLLLLSKVFNPSQCMSGCVQWGSEENILGIFAAAMLGTTFYALTSASEYLKSGTFDPRYNQSYLIRLPIGFCSGLILGFYAQELGIESNVGQEGLALLGGFSAEVVIQILQRIAETLLTAVRGGDKDHAKAQADKVLIKKKADMGIALHEALSQDTDENRKKAIQDIIKGLGK